MYGSAKCFAWKVEWWQFERARGNSCRRRRRTLFGLLPRSDAESGFPVGNAKSTDPSPGSAPGNVQSCTSGWVRQRVWGPGNREGCRCDPGEIKPAGDTSSTTAICARGGESEESRVGL